MSMQDDFKFDNGDRVVVFFPPPENGKRGTIEGCFGLNDNIQRGNQTVVETHPWPEFMYTVRYDQSDELYIAGESDLIAESEWDERRASAGSAT